MKYCLALLLMLMFSLQVLPVKKLGKLLGKIHSTEQVQGDADTDDCSCDGNFCTSDAIIPRCSFDLRSSNGYFENKIAVIIHLTESLPLVNTAQIPAPPPKC